MLSWPLSFLLKNEENVRYKSCLVANRKRCATENVWGHELARLVISSRVKWIRQFSEYISIFSELFYIFVNISFGNRKTFSSITRKIHESDIESCYWSKIRNVEFIFLNIEKKKKIVERIKTIDIDS